MASAELAYFFRHSVLRDAAYQLQLPADRARLHAFAFSILEILHGEFAHSAEAALELADHASLGAIHDAALAPAEKRWLTEAAALAEQQSTSDFAADLWLRVRALAANTPFEAIEATLNAAGNLLQAGRYKEAEQLLSDVSKNPMARITDLFKAAQHLSAVKLAQQRFAEAREDLALLRTRYSELIDPVMDLKLLTNEVLAGKADGAAGSEHLALQGIAKARALNQQHILTTLRLNLANIYRLNGRARESLPILQDEFDAAWQRGANSWIVRIGINLAWTHLALDDVKAARACAEKIAPYVGDAGLVVRHAHEFLLSTISENEGKGDEALDHLVVALDLVLELGQVRDAANTLHSVVLHCAKAGNRAEVSRWLTQFEQLAVTTQDIKALERYEAARSLDFGRRGENEKAFEACQNALGYARKLRAAREESLHLGNAGLHATVLGLPDAEANLQDARRLASSLGETYQLAWWEMRLAIVAALQGRSVGERLARVVQLLSGRFPPARLKREIDSLQEQIARTSKARGVKLDALSQELARLFEMATA
jgi:hypothetical protein